MEYPPSELPLTDDGRAYHLDLSPDMISDKIIVVGDPDRVEVVASFFETIEYAHHHREFSSRTGTYKGKRITALSTGIGTGNIDIVVNELDALANIDLETRRHKDKLRSLNIVRIGTCGILQPDVPVHSYILTEYALGLDSVSHFYDLEYSASERSLNEAINAHVDIPSTVSTYISAASSELYSNLRSECTVQGITVTSCGFYGPQGRALRLKTKTGKLNDQLSSFQWSAQPVDLRVINFEMESSVLFSLGRSLGHHCATICLGIANRPLKTFSDNYQPAMRDLIEYVLERI
jgi:uridine phosphorylase